MGPSKPVNSAGVPTRIGPYSVIEPLATGGMSNVYFAKRDGASRYCAVKCLRSMLLGSEVALKRFRREAHLASFLDHPNIARILDAGVDDKKFYIAYEFIAGHTLTSILSAMIERRTTLPMHVIVTIALRVLDALSYAHELMDPEGGPMDIVHRDLTPHNIMVGYRGEVKVIDFGVARGNINPFRTEPGTVVGTPQYMSPEQVSGNEVDARSDLYTFATVLYEMLTLRPTVAESSAVNMFGAVILEFPPSPSQFNSAISVELEHLLMKSLSKKPWDRWRSASELRTALHAATSGIPSASSVELGALVTRLFPKERKHVLGMSAAEQRDGLATISDGVTLEQLLEEPTQPNASAAEIRAALAEDD